MKVVTALALALGIVAGLLAWVASASTLDTETARRYEDRS